MRRPLVPRIVALVAVLSVAAAAAGPAFGALATAAPCAPGSGECSRSAALGGCCCGHGSPAVPGTERTPVARAVEGQAPGAARVGPDTALCLALLAAARRHGHPSVDLTTLHSRFLL